MNTVQRSLALAAVAACALVAGAARAAPRIPNVLTVAKSGGDFTSVTAALASITDASATKPYLVNVMPGTYDVPDSLYVAPYVTLAGSGQDATSLVLGGYLTADRAEVRDLGIRSGMALLSGGDSVLTNVRFEGAGGYYALQSLGSGFTFRRVTVSGGFAHDSLNTTIEDSRIVATGKCSDWNEAIYSRYGDLTIRNSVIEVSQSCGSITSVGLRSSGGNVVLANSVVRVTEGGNNYGVRVEGGTLTVSGSQIRVEGGQYSNLALDAGVPTVVDASQIASSGVAIEGRAPVSVGASKVAGTLAGAVRCVASYDAAYAPLACP